MELQNKNMEIEGNNSTVTWGNLHSKYTIYKNAYPLPTILDHRRISGISIKWHRNQKILEILNYGFWLIVSQIKGQINKNKSEFVSF